jgi:hypothetical protein
LDRKEAVAAAAAFVDDPQETAAFWSAALLLRHGEGERKALGTDRVIKALRVGDPHARIDVVLDDLLASKDPRVERLVGRYLAKEPGPGHAPTLLVLQRALFLGRTEGFARLLDAFEGRGVLPLRAYDHEGEGDPWSPRETGVDTLAWRVLTWADDPERRITNSGEEAKASRREKAAAALRRLFEGVKAGAPPQGEPEERPVPLGKWGRYSTGWVLRTR